MVSSRDRSSSSSSVRGAEFRRFALAVYRNSATMLRGLVPGLLVCLGNFLELRGLLAGLFVNLESLLPSFVEELDALGVSGSSNSSAFSLRRVTEGRASEELDRSLHRVSSARRVLSSFKYSKSSSSTELLALSQSLDVMDTSAPLGTEIESGWEELFVIIVDKL